MKNDVIVDGYLSVLMMMLASKGDTSGETFMTLLGQRFSTVSEPEMAGFHRILRERFF